MIDLNWRTYDIFEELKRRGIFVAGSVREGSSVGALATFSMSWCVLRMVPPNDPYLCRN